MYGLDLSSLSELGLLFTALFQAFWPIFVILFVGSILLLLLGVGAKFGLDKIFSVVEPGTRVMKQRRHKLSFTIFISVAFLVLLLAAAPASASVQTIHADGTSGSLEIGVTNILDDTPITIKMYDLTIAADFKINWTGEDTGHSFTTGASQTKHYITVNIEKPSATHDVTVYLWPQSTGAALDSLTLYVSDTSIFPDDIIIDIGITIAVVFVIVGVVVLLKKSVSGG